MPDLSASKHDIRHADEQSNVGNPNEQGHRIGDAVSRVLALAKGACVGHTVARLWHNAGLAVDNAKLLASESLSRYVQHCPEKHAWDSLKTI